MDQISANFSPRLLEPGLEPRKHAVTERAPRHAAALVLDGVQRLGERILLILIIIQGLQDAVFDILNVESARVLLAHVTLRPAEGEGDGFLVYALCLSLKVPGEFPRLRKALASTLPFGPKTMSGSRRKFQWIETRKRNGLKGDGASN